ncbi:hypothetical protein HDU96_011114 [Phlyctochytrium bullatum]|nr:hypothetical protein HDU96_011114 [Phlyctochytrium bullatum]
MIEALPHNNFHMIIAGDNQNAQIGDPTVSVYDPIFWLHHNNIDRHWQYFQNANPSLANFFNGVFTNSPRGGVQVQVASSDIMIGFNVPVSAGLGVRRGPICHSFQPYSRSISYVQVKFARLAHRNHLHRGENL